MSKKRILILGVEGMLGNTLFLSLVNSGTFIIKGTQRTKKNKIFNNKNFNKLLIKNLDATNFDKIRKIILKFKPDYIINCIGITNKQILENSKHNVLIINSFMPKFLSLLSEVYNFKFIHISTDCVFNGKKKSYDEQSFKSARDFYGISKSLGEEIDDNKNCLVLRTSIIGHDLKKKDGLLEWFLSQKISVSGFDGVIYSGLTTVEFSRIIIQIIKNHNIYGLYQVSSKKISKFKLLNMIKKIYNFKININKNSKNKKILVLKSNKFTKKTKIKTRNWNSQIKEMKNFYNKYQLPILDNTKKKTLL